MRVMLWPQDFDAPGCYRLLFPAEQFKANEGGEFRLPLMKPKVNPFAGSEFIADATLTDPRMDCDVHVLQQRLERGFAEWLVQSLKQRGKGVVVECDDYYENVPSWNVAGRNLKTHKTLSVEVLAPQRAAADVVTCSTPFLAERYANDNPNTVVIRNGLDWRMWQDVKPMYERPIDGRIRVGWVGAAAWREGDLRVLAEWFPRWIKRHPEVAFVAAGTDGERVHELLKVPRDQRITYPYLDFKSFRHPEFLVATMHIGLVPLVKHDFNEAKSHLKGMEYNAAGIPFVASDSESYRFWHGEGGGFIATKPAEWEELLDALVECEADRVAMGKAGRAAAKHWSIQNRWREWAEAWGQAVREPDDVQVALQAVSYGAIQKIGELSKLVELVRGKKVIVEIGSAAGGTMWAWSKVAADDALIVSIDLPGGIGGGHRSHVAEQRQTAFRRADQQLEMIRGDSHADETLERLRALLAGRRIDVLFIDGDHTYEGVKRDWEMYGRLADVVAFHDIVNHPDNDWCKVDDLWAELKVRSESADMQWTELVSEPDEHWGGIGVIRQPSLVRA